MYTSIYYFNVEPQIPYVVVSCMTNSNTESISNRPISFYDKDTLPFRLPSLF